MTDLTKTKIVNGMWTVWAVCFGLPIAWAVAALVLVVTSPIWIIGCIKHYWDWGRWGWP